MKLRNLFLIGLGIAIGYQISRKLREDDPNVVSGPRPSKADGNGAGRGMVAGQAQRLADQATARSLEAIRRARGAIRTRLAEDTDASWN
jgi:hypothetical protein